MAKLERELDRLEKKVRDLSYVMERIHMDEYIRYLNNTKRIVFVNIISGLSRGVGTAIGFTVITAIILIVVRNLAMQNLPLIGDFIAELVKIVESKVGY